MLLNGVVEGKSVSDAGKDAGYRSRHNAHDALRSIRDRLPELLRKHGLDEDAFAIRLRDKLDATKTVTASFMGQISDSIEVADNPTQMAALELVADLHGMTAKDDGRFSIGTVNILWSGHAPAWAGQSSDAAVNSAIPVSTHADADAQLVHTNTQSVTDAERVPISTLEGTGPGRAASPHTHSGTVAAEGVLTRRVKKRGPRLPVYRGEK